MIRISVSLVIYKIAIILLIYAIILIVSEYSSGIRKLIYIIPFLVLSLFYFTKRKKLQFGNKISDANLYFLIVLSACIISYFFNFINLSLVRFIKEFFFIISALLAALISIKLIDKKGLFVASKILLLVFFISKIQEFIIFRDFNLINFLLNSESSSESYLSYIIGILAIFFLLEKKYKYSFLAIILTILGTKRIAFLALLVAIFVSIIILRSPSLVNRNKKLIIVSSYLGNIFILFILIGIANGYFDDLFVNYIGVTPNFFLKGRANLYTEILKITGNVSIFPKGLGLTSFLLEQGEVPGTTLNLLHSDLLKYFLEFGFILASFMLLLLYKIGAENPFSLPFIVYYNVLMLTDNITIYFEVIFILFIFIFYYSKTDNKNYGLFKMIKFKTLLINQ